MIYATSAQDHARERARENAARAQHHQYVTVNDVANVLLAAGGSPIMSDDADDVEDIMSICGG